MDDDVEFKRLYWHSRRGMLELDLLLIPFLEEVYPHLASDDRERYRQLIDREDNELYQWFMRRGEPEEPELRHMVNMILERARSN